MASFVPQYPQHSEENNEESSPNPNISESNNHLVSLQRQEGWTVPLVLYGNFWMPEFAVSRISDLRRHFVARPTDIIISTFPRSGTIWLKSLLYAIVYRSRHAIDDPSHPLLARNSHDLVPFLEVPFDPSPAATTFLDILRKLDALPSPRILSTHLPYSLLPPSVIDSGCRLVYLCREPKDNFVSMWHFLNKFLLNKVDLDKAFQMYCEGSSPFGPVWEHNIGYWRASKAPPPADKILFLTYEEVTAAPAEVARRLAEFVGHPFTTDEEKQNLAQKMVRLCSIEQMKSSAGNTAGGAKVNEEITIPNAAFLRKGKVGDWSNYLEPEMGEKLDSIVEEKLTGTGLTFQRS